MVTFSNITTVAAFSRAENATVVNVSLDGCGWEIIRSAYRPHPIRFLDLFSYPFLLLLATVGNVFNLIVLTREKPFGSKNQYLIGIAITDLLYMWNSLLIYVSNYDGEIHGRPRPTVYFAVERLSGVTIFFQEACVIASAWLLVVFTMERFLAIKYPLKHLQISHGKRSAIVVCVVVLLAGIIASCRIVDYYWWFNNWIRVEPKPAIRPVRPQELMIWFKIYIWSLTLIQIWTFLTILVMNSLLLRLIIVQQRKRRETLQATHLQEGAPRMDWGALTMLGACVLMYLVTQAPGFVGNILNILELGCIRKRHATTRLIMAPILNVLLNINFSGNFLLYCLANPKFRIGVRNLLSGKAAAVSRRKSQDSNTDRICTKTSRLSLSCAKHLL